jgi:serine/threonine protein kinase
MIIIFVYFHSAPPQVDNSKTVNGEKKLQRNNSFVGTAQFVAPEILKRGAIHVGLVKIFLLKKDYFILNCFRSDLWALGCIIYKKLFELV